MRNEDETKKAKRQWTPPRGIRLLDFPDRPENPYGVQWRALDNTSGKRAPKTKSFPTREAQLEFAKEKARELQQFGTEAPRVDSDEVRKWRAFVAELGPGVELPAVLNCWRKFGPRFAATGPLIGDSIPRYFAIREEEKSWSNDAARHARAHLRRFAAKFGKSRFAEPSVQELREWLFGRVDEHGKRVDVLKDEDGDVIGPHGIKDHRKNVSTFFSYAVREEWGITSNPFDAIKPPKIEDGDPVVMPLRDAFEFFKANRDERVIGRIALEAFGFIRYTTAGKIGKDGLDFDRQGIRMAARIHKSGQKDGRSRYRQGQPANLWAWLKHAPDSCWTMTPLNYREAKRYALIRSGLRPMENETAADEAKIEGLRNVWRHTVISYHLARYQNPGLTQRLAQHASYKQTEDYEGLADESTAARYFMITPETVQLTWDEFLALPIPPLANSSEVKAA